MNASIDLAHFSAPIFLIVSILYFTFYAPAPLSNIRHLFTTSTQRAKAVYLALTSPLAAFPTPIIKEISHPCTEPTEPVRQFTSERRKNVPSLPDGLAHCINSFEQYPFLAKHVLQRKHARYASQTPEQKALSNQLDYAAHFEKAEKGIEVNAQFSKQVARIAREHYQIGSQVLEDEKDADLGVVNLAFGHLSRDWSSQGARERQAVFPSVLGGLQQHFGGNER
jgi:hypothetical protein